MGTGSGPVCKGEFPLFISLTACLIYGNLACTCIFPLDFTDSILLVTRGLDGGPGELRPLSS